jgi:hypothetical protein
MKGDVNNGNGRVELVRLLLDYGAEPDVLNNVLDIIRVDINYFISIFFNYNNM